MVVIIAGSRSARRKHVYASMILCPFADQITTVRSGKNKRKDKVTGEILGADYWGEQWARGHQIPVVGYWPDWNRLSLSAGPIRNTAMLTNNGLSQLPELLILVWTGDEKTSKGSADIRRKAIEYGVPIDEYIIDINGSVSRVTKEGVA